MARGRSLLEFMLISCIFNLITICLYDLNAAMCYEVLLALVLFNLDVKLSQC